MKAAKELLLDQGQTTESRFQSRSSASLVRFACLLLLSLTASLPARALVLRWFIPTNLPGDVQILNKSDEDLQYWMGYPAFEDPVSGQIQYEENKRIFGNSKQRLALSLYRQHPWIQIKIHEEDEEMLIVKLRTWQGDVYDLPLNKASTYTTALDRNYKKFLINNLSEIDQNAELIETLPSGKKKVTPLFLPAKGHLEIQKPNEAVSLSVHGNLPLIVSWVSEDTFRPWTAVADERPFSKREARRFLAVDSSGRESFVVPIADARLIEEAREQIRNPDSSQRNIIFALPVLSQGAENRNLKNPYRTPWSWEIKEVYGFESFGSDSCNGTPSIVEDFLHFWTGSERLICFRDYRIVTELE